MKKIKFRQIIAILFYTLFFLLLLKNSFSYLDPDFGWHLKVGQEIYNNRNVPSINHYNYVFSETENFWVDHEWLSNLLLFLSYDNFGYIFINIFFALIIIFAFIILNKFISKQIVNDPRVIYFLLPIETLGIKAILPHSGVRIQEISILFLALLLIIIYLFEKRALENKKNYYFVLFLLIPLLYLWANLHAGFLLGIALIFFYLLIKIIEKIFFNFKNNKIIGAFHNIINFSNNLSTKNIKIFLLFTVLATISTALTPYGLKLFDFLYSYGNNAYLKLISEWLPQYYWPFMYTQIFYIIIIITCWALTFIFYKKYKEEAHGKIFFTPWMLALNLLFLFLAIKSKRHFPLFFISTLPFIVSFLYSDFKILLTPSKKPGNKILDISLKTFIICTFLISILAISISIDVVKNPFNHYKNYPQGATAFLKQNHEKYSSANLFNYYNWGGYLIYEYPERKLFIDGRLPQKTLNNHSSIEEYELFFSSDKQIIENKIKEYNIKLFLLNIPQKVTLNWLDKNIFKLKESDFSDKNNLIEYLKEKNVTKIYEDEISVIYHQE